MSDETTDKPVKQKKKKPGPKKKKKKPGPKPNSKPPTPPPVIIKKTIVKRGDCPTDSKGKPWMPTPKQIQIARLLLDLEDKRTKTEKCKEAGITISTLNNWQGDPNFVAWLNDTLKICVRSKMADMYKYLETACKRGNVQAIRLWFELAGAINNTQKVELTGKNGEPIQANGNINIVFGSGSGMAEPPGKREEIIDVEGSEVIDVETTNSEEE